MHCAALLPEQQRARLAAPPGDHGWTQAPRREEGPFSGAGTLLNVTATSPDLTELERRPFPTPRGRGSRAAVSGAREAVRWQVRPWAGPGGRGGSPAALLLGIVHPAVLGGPLLPAQGQLVLAVRVVQARIAQGCHGGTEAALGHPCNQPPAPGSHAQKLPLRPGTARVRTQTLAPAPYAAQSPSSDSALKSSFRNLLR